MVLKGCSLFKQRRQDVENFVTRMSRRHNVVDTKAVLLFVRRVSDAHGRTL